MENHDRLHLDRTYHLKKNFDFTLVHHYMALCQTMYAQEYMPVHLFSVYLYMLLGVPIPVSLCVAILDSTQKEKDDY